MHACVLAAANEQTITSARGQNNQKRQEYSWGKGHIQTKLIIVVQRCTVFLHGSPTLILYGLAMCSKRRERNKTDFMPQFDAVLPKIEAGLHFH